MELESLSSDGLFAAAAMYDLPPVTIVGNEGQMESGKVARRSVDETLAARMDQEIGTVVDQCSRGSRFGRVIEIPGSDSAVEYRHTQFASEMRWVRRSLCIPMAAKRAGAKEEATSQRMATQPPRFPFRWLLFQEPLRRAGWYGQR